MRRLCVSVLLLILAMSGCGFTSDTQPKDNASTGETVYTSNTSTEDCFLCGNGIDEVLGSCLGQKNIAFISLNTFEVQPIEINRYDRLDNHMIEEPAGYLTFARGPSLDDGFFVNMMLEYDRRYATGTLDFGNDKEIDVDAVASFLCTDCMNEILPREISDCYGVGVLDLVTKEIHIFEENFIGFGVGDFHIEWYWVDPDSNQDRIHILAFYCPVLYGTNA